MEDIALLYRGQGLHMTEEEVEKNKPLVKLVKSSYGIGLGKQALPAGIVRL